MICIHILLLFHHILLLYYIILLLLLLLGMLLFNGRNASGPESAHYIFIKRTRPTRRRMVMKCLENGPRRTLLMQDPPSPLSDWVFTPLSPPTRKKSISKQHHHIIIIIFIKMMITSFQTKLETFLSIIVFHTRTHSYTNSHSQPMNDRRDYNNNNHATTITTAMTAMRDGREKRKTILNYRLFRFSPLFSHYYYYYYYHYLLVLAYSSGIVIYMFSTVTIRKRERIQTKAL